MLALGGFAVSTGMGGAGQHAIFGRDPALAAPAQEGRNLFVDARGAEHSRIAEADEASAFGVAGEAGFKTKFTHLVGGASGRAHICILLILVRGVPRPGKRSILDGCA